MKYFTIHELTKSATAKAKRIDNTPTDEVIQNLIELVDKVLDPLREAWGRPIIVNSGYRSPKLNSAVGGVPTSHHVKGMAVDITAGTRYGNEQLFKLVQKLKLPFTQLIDEKNFQWVHVSFDKNNIKKEILHL